MWGEDRVAIELPDRTVSNIPIGWTDLVSQDPYHQIGQGKSLYRVCDLLELTKQIDKIKNGKGNNVK